MAYLFGGNPAFDSSNLWGGDDRTHTRDTVNANDGTAEGVYFEFSNSATRTVRAVLYDADDNLIASSAGETITTSGPQLISFTSPVAVSAGATYRYGLQTDSGTNMLINSGAGSSSWDRNTQAYSLGAPDPWTNSSSISEAEPILYVYGTLGSAADTDPPTFDTAPATGTITTTSAQITATLNESGRLKGILLTDGATAPSDPAQAQTWLTAGAGSNNVVAVFDVAATASTQATGTFSSLSPGTAYDWYVWPEDDEATPNVAASLSSGGLTTHRVGFTIPDIQTPAADGLVADDASVRIVVWDGGAPADFTAAGADLDAVVAIANGDLPVDVSSISGAAVGGTGLVYAEWETAGGDRRGYAELITYADMDAA